MLTGEDVAMKVEPSRSRHPRLLYEAKCLKQLSGGLGLPVVHWYGTEGDKNLMVMDLLGPSLEDLLNLCNHQLSMKTVLMLADMMLNRLEYIHAKGFVHRDIKPDNFLVGFGKKVHQLYIIDFGLTKKYRDSHTQQHIPYKDQKALIGTARYASINTHQGIEQSRRDDLESVGYVLVYLLHGRLPWQGLAGRTAKEKYEEIMKRKLSISPEALCCELPPEFATYLRYCRRLSFEDRPDYAYMRKLFREVFNREGYQADFIFDWHHITQWASYGEMQDAINAIKVRRFTRL